MLRRIMMIALAVAAVAAAAARVEAGAEARLRGAVVDSAGQPIAAATIRITTEELSSFDKVVEVKPDGTFSTMILDATKRYTFHVEAPGYAPLQQHFKVAVGSTDNEFRFELKTTAEIADAEQAERMDQPGYRELQQASELLQQGDAAGARAALEAAVAAKPGLQQAWVGLAELAYAAGEVPAALQYAERCLELDDEEIRCLAVAANACRDLGQTERHQSYIGRYEQLNPSDPATIFNRAVVHLNAYDDAAARPILEECIAADPTFANCHFEYGMLLLRASELELAKRHLERYLEVAPEGNDAATARETLKYLE